MAIQSYTPGGPCESESESESISNCALPCTTRSISFFEVHHAEASEVVERPTSPLRVGPAVVTRGVPDHCYVPNTTLFENLEISARRFPDKAAIQFFGVATTYAELLDGTERLAAYLQHECGIVHGDRVALYSQNSPQFIYAYFAILRANAVVVPVNPMLLEHEVRHIIEDSGAVAGFVASELLPRVAPLIGSTSLRRLVTHHYGDALTLDHQVDPDLPGWLRVRSTGEVLPSGATPWQHAREYQRAPAPHRRCPDDLCMLPYTSGTTGAPKACMHTHRTVMASVAGSQLWRGCHTESAFLAVSPMFHLLGLQTESTCPFMWVGPLCYCHAGMLGPQQR